MCLMEGGGKDDGDCDLVRLAMVGFALMVVWMYLPGFVFLMFGKTAPGRSAHTLLVQ